jgi:hypothetical protein
VPQARAVVVAGVEVLPPSSNTHAAGAVGMMPIAAGGPHRKTLVVAAAMETPVSMSL